MKILSPMIFGCILSICCAMDFGHTTMLQSQLDVVRNLMNTKGVALQREPRGPDSAVWNFFEAVKSVVEANPLQSGMIKVASDVELNMESRIKSSISTRIRDESIHDDQKFIEDAAYFLFCYNHPVFLNVFGVSVEKAKEEPSCVKAKFHHYVTQRGQNIFSMKPFSPNILAKLLWQQDVWVKVLEKLFGGFSFKENLADVIIFDEKHVKSFPEKGQKFGRDHINSAVTFVDPPRPVMILYRIEELTKVFLHELVHVCLDDSMDTRYSEKILGASNSGETFVETMTVLIHTALRALTVSKGSGAWEIFEQDLMTERYFSVFQTAKIMLINGFSTYAEYTKNNMVVLFSNHGGINYREYYIYKSAVLGNLEKFLPLYRTELDRSNLDPDIVLALKEEKFASAVQALMDIIEDLEKSYGLQILMKTGRMTIVENPQLDIELSDN